MMPSPSTSTSIAGVVVRVLMAIPEGVLEFERVRREAKFHAIHGNLDRG